MLSPDVQTASLESYHAVVCRFAPKMNHFTYPVMEARLYLAAMHFNENSDREYATTADGELQWRLAWPKAAKGTPYAKPVKEKATRGYIDELLGEVVNLRNTHPTYKKASDVQKEYSATTPSKSAEYVDKAAVVSQHCPRMNWRVNSAINESSVP